MRRRGSHLHVYVSRTSIRAETRRGEAQWTAETAYETPEDLADAIARIAAELPARCRTASIVLAHPPAQLRTIVDLPPVAGRDLANLVAHQASRYFRKNGKPLATDAVWLHTRPARVAQAVAVEEPLLEAMARGLAAAGIRPLRMTVEGSRAGLELRTTRDQARRSRDARHQLRWALGFGIGMWIAVALAWGVRIVVERRAVDREMAALSAPLTAIGNARREIRDANAIVGALRVAEEERRSALDLLGGLAGALPDSAILTSLAWTATGTGVLTGAGRRAADVLADLERHHAVPNPRLDGPVIRESVAGRTWDRFAVTFGAASATGRP